MASRPLDLIGEQYGKLTVISKAEKRMKKQRGCAGVNVGILKLSGKTA